MSARLAPLALALTLAAAAAASGQEPTPTPRFTEVSAEWGVDFVHRHGGTGEFYMIETMGSGVVAFDYDGDGDDDLFFVQSGELPIDGAGGPGGALYRNDGAAGFVDVTAAAELALEIYGMGATAGDVDGDGDPDLYVTAYGVNRMLRNDGDGTFSDVTEAAGVGDPLWGASASFADVEADGDLDLYVTNYVDFTFDDNPPCGLQSRGLRSYCHPDVYDGLPDRFYRNRGDGTFEDATAAAGFGGANGKGLGVVFGDVDLDGDDDLYVANDMTPNFLFRNRGDGTFEETALLAGVAFSERGDVEAGMGLELGDVDDNGFPDILVTHLDLQTNAVYGNSGTGLFVDRRFATRIAEPSYHKVGFGIGLADFDQDGYLDVAIANGHIIHNVDQWGATGRYRQPNQILRNRGDGTFVEVADAGLDVVLPSRGLALSDLDGDGDPDLAISNSNDRAEIYRNVSPAPGGWLQLSLDGGRPAVGAAVELETGERRQWRQLRAASSYMSQGSSVLHFGLGAAPRADTVRLRWPGGRRLELHDLPANRRIHLEFR